jgi:hypothetical protein
VEAAAQDDSSLYEVKHGFFYAINGGEKGNKKIWKGYPVNYDSSNVITKAFVFNDFKTNANT